ncbi:hypothetical protein L6164_009425 [Bauhinia variegata]|uniref:Uncharacterized protein n=1 Tax=Bauhinia variegata TaxID=167791 RepID=A0ACB9PL63_BAUVA|nr:hypothetical protein L6164_009425 [Bauhinia variegata]
MSVCSPVGLSSMNVVVLKGRSQLLLSSNFSGPWFQGKSGSCCFNLRTRQSTRNHAGLSIWSTSSCSTITVQISRGNCLGSCFSKQKGNIQFFCSGGPRRRHLENSFACQSINTRLLVPKPEMLPKVKCNVGPSSRPITWPRGCGSAGLIFGLLVCYSSSKPEHAEAYNENENKKDKCDESRVQFSHGKKVFTDYSVIGIPGDGRCLFRSIAHGACLRSGKPPPSESLQRQLADELRASIADEYIKRREETEWFVEGDFDTYVSQIRKPHIWGGEPELFMASHVLKMPITVYMYDKAAGGLISIAEYGQEYGKENPIRVLYHGFGHYDALDIPGKKGLKPRL